jgi:hypothetical protein
MSDAADHNATLCQDLDKLAGIARDLSELLRKHPA